MLAIWSLVSLPFLNPAWTSGSSWLTYCWSLAWRILSITLLAYEMSAIVRWFEHSLALPFFGIGMKTDLFQSCGHCWVFHICWHTQCSTFTASSFRIWNSSTGIPSPPLALFVVMLPKAHLTSDSRMSGLGEWAHHCGYLGHEDLFCTVLCILAPVRAILFLSFIVSIFVWIVPLVSLIFLTRSLVFPILLFSSIFLEGFLISPCYSFELCIQIGVSFLFSFAFSFPSFLSYL